MLYELRNQDCEINDILPMLQIWNGGFYAYDGAPRLCHGLLLVLSGGITYTSGAQTLTAVHGDIVYLPEGSFYRAGFDGETRNLLVNFKISRPDLQKSDFPVLIKSGSLYLKEYFEKMIDAAFSAPKNIFEVKANLYSLLSILSENSENTVFQRAALLLRDSKLSVDEVARECSVSQSTLRRLFRQNASLSPVEFRIRYKITQAEAMLADTEMSPKMICYSLGFSDEAYFYRVFKKYTSKTPLEYRNSINHR